MNSKNAIQEELRDLDSSLPKCEKPVFDLPEGYFENFAASVLAKIKGEAEISVQEELQHLSSTLSTIPRTMPFSVPEAYFANLTSNLPTLLKDDFVPEELKKLAKRVPYDVPVDYFENLPAQILSKVAKPKAKVVSMSARHWVRYAAAAIVTGLIAISGILYFKNNTGKEIALDPLKEPKAWVADKLEDVSNQDLEEFISTTDVGLNGKEIVQTVVTAQEVRKLLNDIPDNELDVFLDEVPTESEEALMVN
jgi:hypothetical protein